MLVSRSFAYVTQVGPHERLAHRARSFAALQELGGPKNQITPLALVQHMPAGWTARYNERCYLFTDPVFHRLQADPQPDR